MKYEIDSRDASRLEKDFDKLGKSLSKATGKYAVEISEEWKKEIFANAVQSGDFLSAIEAAGFVDPYEGVLVDPYEGYLVAADGVPYSGFVEFPRKGFAGEFELQHALDNLDQREALQKHVTNEMDEIFEN